MIILIICRVFSFQNLNLSSPFSFSQPITITPSAHLQKFRAVFVLVIVCLLTKYKAVDELKWNQFFLFFLWFLLRKTNTRIELTDAVTS